MQRHLLQAAPRAGPSQGHRTIAERRCKSSCITRKETKAVPLNAATARNGSGQLTSASSKKEGNAENKVCCREAAGRVSRKQRSPKTTVKRGSLEKLRRTPPSPVPASLTCLSTPSRHKRVLWASAWSCGQRLRLAPRHSGGSSGQAAAGTRELLF